MVCTSGVCLAHRELRYCATPLKMSGDPALEAEYDDDDDVVVTKLQQVPQQWSESMKFALIDEVRPHRDLWDINSNGYKNKPKVRELWSRISKNINEQHGTNFDG